MCGLFGIYPKAGADALSLRLLALFLGLGNVNRGRHSFGVWSRGVAPLRGLGSINDEDNIPAFRDYVFNSWTPEENKWLAGHTRQATHGAKTLENTHPFAVGNIILAHNGVVSVEGYGEKEHAVDSGRIALSIVDHGWAPGIAKVSGSCALVVSVDDNLLLYRHNQVLHMVEEPWGWAISSEKNTLSEAIKLAGLSLAEKPKEIIADHVIGPWDKVSLPCPAKAYVAPTYNYTKDSRDFGRYGGRWVEGNWVPWKTPEERDEFWKTGFKGTSSDFSHGSSATKGNTGTQQPLPYSQTPDQKAKDKFLSKDKDGEYVIPLAHVQRAATEMILRRGKDTKGNYIKLEKGGRIREHLMNMAFELERHEKMLTFVCDPETKITTKMITPLGVAESWYMTQTEDQKDGLWLKFYGELLTGVGVTVEEYKAALLAYETGGDLDDTKILNEYAVCDWCGNVRETSSLKTCNFGLDPIKVCNWCETDFKAARRGLDFRDKPGKVKDGRKTCAEC
jgi:hypothetical protein